jgi:hypothetical protein
VAEGVPGRLRPRIFLTFGTTRVVGRRNPWYSFSEAESTPGHIVPSGATEKSPVPPPGIDLGTSRLVAERLNHYATPGPLLHVAGINGIRRAYMGQGHSRKFPRNY